MTITHSLLKSSNSKATLSLWLSEKMDNYKSKSMLRWEEEDALCELFFSSISGKYQFDNDIINIDYCKNRGRGPKATEKVLGADGIGLVFIETTEIVLNGYFLFQAKKSINEKEPLPGSVESCQKMLKHSAASYLLVLMPTDVKMVGVMAITAFNSGNPKLLTVPYMNFSNFFQSQLLRGLMLEPLMNIWNIPIPIRSINYVMTITGADREDSLIEMQIKTKNVVKDICPDFEVGE